MQFDPSKPMILDSDNSPGKGAGFWYTDATPPNVDHERSGGRITFIVILSGLLIGVGHMLLT